MKAMAWALGLLAGIAGGVGAQEGQPAPWVLDFRHGPLEVYTLNYKDGSAESFYYITFKLTNSSQQAAKLALSMKATVHHGWKKTTTHVAVPAPNAEEAIRRLARAPDLLNVQQINAKGMLAPGESLRGIAVLGTFNRQWDTATVLVSGLEPFTRNCRVRKYGDAGFTMSHRAYAKHNEAVLAKAGADATFEDAQAIVQHDVVWKMEFHREGDEFGPQLDPIVLDTEGWNVLGPKIIHEKRPPFGG